jgi:hypothetical protein
MDIQGILSNLLGSKLTSMRTEDGVTYGPAVSLVSRTPISYGTLPPNRSGEFYPDTKTIKIDPTKGNVARVTRHEQIHALLDKIPMEGAPQTTSAPGFMDIARTLQPMVAGDMENEVPAYMAQQPTSGFYGISDQQRNAYMGGLVDQLQKLDPNIAQRIAKLANRGQ